jgi:hypothetical protein
MKIFSFGKIIPNLKIYGEEAPYPVLNERDARAAAGIMLVMGILAFVNALLLQNFMYLYVFVLLFALEFGIRIFINPSLAPFYALGTLFVSNQIPEYTGAAQKRFAWSLGFGLAFVMSLVVFVFNIKGIIPFSICSVCLILLWLETSLGLCVGCKMYNWFINVGLIKKPKHMPACPGGVCSIKKN